MDQAIIFQPFIGTMILTMVVWVYMYSRRLPFIFSNRINPKQMTPLEFARISPASVSNSSDNLKNLFELPTVFYSVVIYLYVTDQVDISYLRAAWVFFIFRVLHSVVHCTFNLIPLRFVLYVISAFAVWFMVIKAAIAAIA